MNCISKIVVFDLDETLGYFVEFGMFWDALSEYLINIKKSNTLNQQSFNKILDLYPEFKRPNIENILTYLKKKKEYGKCNKIMIYTNNQGPKIWSEYIKTYFETKINYPLFDQIIAAFKVNGKMIEICRTSHVKSHKDLVRCTKIPENTQICFLDDTFYPDMSNDKVYYINIKPYIHSLSFETMLERFMNSKNLEEMMNISNELTKEEKEECKNFIYKYMKRYIYTHNTKTKDEMTIDNILSKKILEHLHSFFKKYEHNYTQKNKSKQKMNKTKRKKI
jgi:hypothetical protein